MFWYCIIYGLNFILCFSSPPKIATLFRKVHLNFVSGPWVKIRKYIEFIPYMYYLNVSVYGAMHSKTLI